MGLDLVKFNRLTVFQAHPWFKGVEWDKLYQMKAAFIPEVNDELDTQNFEKFEEVCKLPFSILVSPSVLQQPFCAILICLILMSSFAILVCRVTIKFQQQQNQVLGGRLAPINC